MRKRHIVNQFFIVALLHVLSVGTALASETLFYIVKKADWQAAANASFYHSPALSITGFIPLSTPEQVVATARASFQGQTDLLLLKLTVSATDPRLKWEAVPGSSVSFPHYYGDLPKSLVKKVYSFRPQRNGSFVLPKDSFLKRTISWATPKSLVDKFLSYQDWQKTERFQRLQDANFKQAKVRLQWWYFDFFLRDGSSVVVAFIPQHWWEETKSGEDKKAVFIMSLKTKQGLVKRFATNVPQSEIKSSANQLDIPSRLVIKAAGSGYDREYSIQVSFPEVTGTFTIRPTELPFAPYPTGLMPGPLRTVLSDAPVGSPSFSYVAQIPNSTVSGSLAWDDYRSTISGQAYHEQGRLDDTPARQGGSWSWYHFAGSGWNIFGTPGSFIYLQRGDQILRAGFYLMSKNYTLQNRTFSSPEHPKLLTGGEIYFRHEDIDFRLTLSPATTKTLICFPSSNPNQIWGTVEGPATLSIFEGATTKVLEGQMFLETCSWDTGEEKKISPLIGRRMER